MELKKIAFITLALAIGIMGPSSSTWAAKCQLYVIVVNGKAILYFDPLDPNCPKFH